MLINKVRLKYEKNYRIRKKYVMFSLRLKSSACKYVYNDRDLKSINSHFIDGICTGLTSAGICYDSSFVNEMYEAWENEPPYKK